MNTLGTRIAQMRRQKGMTQEELAEKLGLSSQAVSKWENDVSCPDISLLPQLARLLGCTVDELLTGESSSVVMLPEKERKPLEQLTLRIYVHSSDGDLVKVNLPMPLVKLCLEMGVDIAPQIHGVGNGDALKNIDLGKLMELAEQGLIGKLIEVKSADGDSVEIVVE